MGFYGRCCTVVQRPRYRGQNYRSVVSRFNVTVFVSTATLSRQIKKKKKKKNGELLSFCENEFLYFEICKKLSAD